MQRIKCKEKIFAQKGGIVMDTKKKTLFVGVDEIMEDVGCSRSKAYAIIRDLSKQMKQENSKLLVVTGKINRAYYEEVCMMR
jgi:hypothetical protein